MTCCSTPNVLTHTMPSGEIWTKCIMCKCVTHGPLTVPSTKYKTIETMSKESVWNDTKGVGFGYYKRLGLPGEKGQWEFYSWKECGALDYKPPLTRAIAEQHVIDWQNGLYQYALVQCGVCHNFHNGVSDWTGTRCLNCKPYSNSDIKVGNAMKNGEVRKLPKSSSPMWSEQWAAQGTAKVPYIVSRKAGNKALWGNNATEDGWACSCADFTRHTPRAECKHIIRVQKKEGLLTPVNAGAGLLPSQQAAFAKFLAQEKIKKIAAANMGDIKMVGDKTGRKFR
jgi:hypothetical protein